MNVLELQVTIMYLCTAQPTFDCSAIAFRMQLAKDNAVMNVMPCCCQENKLMSIVLVCLEVCIQ